MKQTIKLCMLTAILALCGSATQRVTPYEWFKWTSPGSQLSLRGGVLETEMGQFFRKWVVDEGLLPDNYRPEGEEVLFYANSRQRTFATAKYFSAGFLPFANVEITHKLKEDKMDPVFTPQFTKMNDTEQVLDMAHSPAAKNDTTHFWFDGTNDYVAVNLVYQSLTQLQNRTLLSLETPPMVFPITIEGLTANSDGLYRLSDLDARMAETMAEYDAIEDVPSAIRVVANTDAASQPAVIYNLQGQRLNSPHVA